MAHIFYHDGENEVQMGDLVETKFWLLFYRVKKRGRVVYIPGVSPLNNEFQHNGLTWVGIRPDDDRNVIGEPVDPKTSRLLKRVRFVKRDTSPSPEADLPDDSDPEP